MGGLSKGSSESSRVSIPADTSTGNSEENAALMEAYLMGMGGLMAQQNAYMQASLAQQESLSTPAVYENEDIDWTSKNEELRAKMAADYTTEQAKRQNRTSTILTSPLLDDEETATTTTKLGGGDDGV
jgi:hypothetical protein